MNRPAAVPIEPTPAALADPAKRYVVSAWSRR